MEAESALKKMLVLAKKRGETLSEEEAVLVSGGAYANVYTSNVERFDYKAINNSFYS